MFSRIDDYSYIPDEVYLYDLREESEKDYATHNTVGVGFTYVQASLIALAGDIALVTRTASDMLWHYLDNTGADYKLDVDDMLNCSDVSRLQYDKLVQLAKKYAESILLDGNKITFISNIVKAHEYGGLLDTNWNASVGACSGVLICEASKESGVISMRTKYIVFDFYDFDKGSKKTFIPTVTDGDMYTLHESGYAKEFYVYGEYLYDYTF